MSVMTQFQKLNKIFHFLASKSSIRAGEMGPDFYDKAFEENDDWRSHYTQSEYYYLWSVILDRVNRGEFKNILEIGCGSGQLAKAIDDLHLVDDYCGVDFSQLRVDYAKNLCPEYRFVVADVFESSILEDYPYDLVIATEFLEHVERDLDVMGKIESTKTFIGTVPNFPWVSHVRHFESASEVEHRYAYLFSEFDVLPLKADNKGKTFFLIQGVKS